MANAIDEYRDWMNANSGQLRALLEASAEIATALRPVATRRRMSVAQLVNGDAVTVRAMADGVGLAGIAGVHSVDPDGVLKALAMTVKFATIIGAFA